MILEVVALGMNDKERLEGGAVKVEAAVAAIRRILPSADVAGVNLTIPMPGHPVDPKRIFLSCFSDRLFVGVTE